ncbi:Recombination protein O, RecO [Candidatus Omnitrophus magneticus]|uniref:DNA repair protein RecO n=1 Tax=Candidatus Omnitrophus magneticus TaxID=1609969 RepID=A0A0F0CN98_9BACT|nr:Recombination protein O, RecO [Candidatus Omnitrophus magneticus]
MPVLHDEGIILRKYSVRETSYIFVIFTKKHGKIRGTLKGVRKPYPQFAGNFEMMNRCGISFYRRKKKALDLITGCEAIEPFLNIRKDILRLTYSNYFIELIDKITVEYDVNEGLYTCLSEALRELSGKTNPKHIARIFELKILQSIGFRPRLEQCARCGEEKFSDIFFSAPIGGILCGHCANQALVSLKISRGAVNFMKKILEIDISRATRVNVTRESAIETEKALSAFIDYYIDSSFNTKKFIDDLESDKNIILDFVSTL